jgi:hypothetical protein
MHRIIEHLSLPWEGGFPATYDWFQSNNTETHVLVAQPKSTTSQHQMKRGLGDTTPDQAGMKARHEEPKNM